jgi:hypothetical protein
VIENAVSVLAPLASGAGLTCSVTSSATTHDPIFVQADVEKLDQILMNLIGNAIKFTPKGGQITIDASRCATDASLATISVRDTGVGIAPAKLASIFEPFAQRGGIVTSQHQGVGLGLSISRTLARGMGGDLTATSQPGVGTTLTLTIPEGLELLSGKPQLSFAGLAKGETVQGSWVLRPNGKASGKLQNALAGSSANIEANQLAREIQVDVPSPRLRTLLERPEVPAETNGLPTVLLVPVTLTPATGFASARLALTYDPAVIQAFDVSRGRAFVDQGALLPGWQFVNVHVDYTTNTAGVSPFDPTHVVAADVAVDSGLLALPIPDLVP